MLKKFLRFFAIFFAIFCDFFEYWKFAPRGVFRKIGEKWPKNGSKFDEILMKKWSQIFGAQFYAHRNIFQNSRKFSRKFSGNLNKNPRNLTEFPENPGAPPECLRDISGTILIKIMCTFFEICQNCLNFILRKNSLHLFTRKTQMFMCDIIFDNFRNYGKSGLTKPRENPRCTDENTSFLRVKFRTFSVQQHIKFLGT